jgi:hypothetical protein
VTGGDIAGGNKVLSIFTRSILALEAKGSSVEVLIVWFDAVMVDDKALIGLPIGL